MILLLDELGKSPACIFVGWVCTLGSVHANPFSKLLTFPVHHLHEGHLRFHAALHGILHIHGLEVNLLLYKGVKSCIDRQQDLFYLAVGLDGLLALTVQTALTRVP